MEDKRYNEDYVADYDFFNEGKNYKEECDFLKQAFQKFSNNEAKTILDIGCGTGLHTKELTSEGFEVTGLDLSEQMIKKAKERNPKSNFFIGNMANFDINKKFDTCICMFSSIGYLTTNKEIEGFFNSVKKHLKQDGLLIIDCWNGLCVMNELPTSREKRAKRSNIEVVRTSYPTLKAEEHLNDINFKVKVYKDNNLEREYTEHHIVRFFFPQELKKYISDAGFELLKVCPSYNINQDIDEKCWNMVLIAKLKS